MRRCAGQPGRRPYAQYVAGEGAGRAVTGLLPLPLWLRDGHGLTPHDTDPSLEKMVASLNQTGLVYKPGTKTKYKDSIKQSGSTRAQ